MSSEFGEHIRYSIFGQSHGGSIGVLIDGLPAGEAVDLAQLQTFLLRRAPGRAAWSTKRQEADEPEFLSGLMGNVTCGAPLCAIIRNSDAHSSDYAALHTVPRPGHADFAAMLRDGESADLRGGGHFSGRLTAPLCVAGGIAKQILARRGIFIGAHIRSVADIEDTAFDPVALTREELLAPGEKEFPVIDGAAGERMQDAILRASRELDSLGGVVECCALGVPAGGYRPGDVRGDRKPAGRGGIRYPGRQGRGVRRGVRCGAPARLRKQRPVRRGKRRGTACVQQPRREPGRHLYRHAHCTARGVQAHALHRKAPSKARTWLRLRPWSWKSRAGTIPAWSPARCPSSKP